MGSPEDVASLGRSMRDGMQLQPIVVWKNGDRYELIAGHRRVYAARVVGMVDIEAKLVEAEGEELALLRFQENKQRLEVSPYEEAVFLAELLENLECSQAELANKLDMSAAYVAQRLAILRGYEAVREALRRGEINFAQCRELMQFPDEASAKQYLGICIEGGAKSDLLRRWRQDVEQAYRVVDQSAEELEAAATARTLVRMQLLTCECCATVMDPSDIVYLKVCHLCEKTLKKSISSFRKE